MQLLEEQLFCDLYDTLKDITTEYGEPSPAELWDEAAARWKPLLASKRPQTAVKMLGEELTEAYGERGAFLVLMILMYMLVTMFRPSEDSPYRPFCEALAAATHGHPLLRRLWEGVRQTEDEEERAGRKIGVVCSLLADARQSGEPFSLDTVEECILRYPTFELQQTALERANNLLMGTAWGTRSAQVFQKMIDKRQEQQERREEMEENMKKAANRPSVTMNVELVRGNKTDIATNYGPNIDNHDGGTVGLPSAGAVPDSLPQTGGDKEQ